MRKSDRPGYTLEQDDEDIRIQGLREMAAKATQSSQGEQKVDRQGNVVQMPKAEEEEDTRGFVRKYVGGK